MNNIIKNELTYVVLFSGGESSACVAYMAKRRVDELGGKVILLNHDISLKAEHEDIKRFKNEVAENLNLPITYANMENWYQETPISICRKLGGFKFRNGHTMCTTKLKTEPFHKYLKDNFPVDKSIISSGNVREDVIFLYGFDKNETHRIQRRIGVMANMGYKCDFPLAFWDNPIKSSEDFGIKKPITYQLYKHANCRGCLKAGKQSWYITYCLHPDIWKEAILAEKEIGYSILNDCYLEELEPKFKKIKCRGIEPSEIQKNPAKFWAEVRKALPVDGQLSFLPCECTL